MSGPKRLSFCITCKNRASQLKKTLCQNLRDNSADRREIEFVLVDFDTPGVREYVEQTCQAELADGYLRYFHTTAVEYWSAPLCKNTSHVLARGTILVNLDVDNFTHARGGRFVMDVFDKYGMDILFHQRDPDHSPTSTFGRIALSRTSFLELGGYNEDLLPVTFQDTDLVKRFEWKWRRRIIVEFEKKQQQQPSLAALSRGVQELRTDRNRACVAFPSTGCPTFVPQTDQDKVAAVDPKYLRVAKTNGWNATRLKKWMLEENMRIAKEARAKNGPTSNVGRTHLGVDPLQITEPLRSPKVFYLRLRNDPCARLRTLLAYAFVAQRRCGHVYFQWSPDEECHGRFEQCFLAMSHCTQMSPDEFAWRTRRVERAKRDCEHAFSDNGNQAAVLLDGHRPWSAMVQQYDFPEDGALRGVFTRATLRLVARLQQTVDDFAAAHCLANSVGMMAERADVPELVGLLRAKVPQQRCFLVVANSGNDTERRIRDAFPAAVAAAVPPDCIVVRTKDDGIVGEERADLEHTLLDLYLLGQCGDIIVCSGDKPRTLPPTAYSSSFSCFTSLARLLCSHRAWTPVDVQADNALVVVNENDKDKPQSRSKQVVDKADKSCSRSRKPTKGKSTRESSRRQDDSRHNKPAPKLTPQAPKSDTKSKQQRRAPPPPNANNDGRPVTLSARALVGAATTTDEVSRRTTDSHASNCSRGSRVMKKVTKRVTTYFVPA